MRRIVGASMLLLLSAAAAAWGVPAEADTPTVVVFTAPTGSLAGPPVPLLSGAPSAVGTIRATVAAGTTTSSVPGVLLLPPQRQTGAYVIPVTSTAPSLPGVTQYGLQVVVPPVPVRGLNPVLVLPALLQSALPPGTYVVLPVH